MYHISKDKRAERSAQKIGDGLLACLSKKEFAEITVTDVQNKAAVGRATFYRLFDNLADVLSYLCDEVFEKAQEQYKKSSPNDTAQSTLMFIKIWMENKVLLKAIIDCNRTDFIFSSHMKYLPIQKEMLFSKENIDETQMTYLMTIFTACTAATLTAWLKNGGKESAEQIHKRIKECFFVLNEIYSR